MAEEREIKELGAIINRYNDDWDFELGGEVSEKEIEKLENKIPLDFIEHKLENPIPTFEKIATSKQDDTPDIASEESNTEGESNTTNPQNNAVKNDPESPEEDLDDDEIDLLDEPLEPIKKEPVKDPIKAKESSEEELPGLNLETPSSEENLEDPDDLGLPDLGEVKDNNIDNEIDPVPEIQAENELPSLDTPDLASSELEVPIEDSEEDSGRSNDEDGDALDKVDASEASIPDLENQATSDLGELDLAQLDETNNEPDELTPLEGVEPTQENEAVDEAVEPKEDLREATAKIEPSLNKEDSDEKSNAQVDAEDEPILEESDATKSYATGDLQLEDEIYEEEEGEKLITNKDVEKGLLAAPIINKLKIDLVENEPEAIAATKAIAATGTPEPQLERDQGSIPGTDEPASNEDSEPGGEAELEPEIGPAAGATDGENDDEITIKKEDLLAIDDDVTQEISKIDTSDLKENEVEEEKDTIIFKDSEGEEKKEGSNLKSDNQGENQAPQSSEELYKKALSKISKYKPKNKNIIYQIIYDNQISPKELEALVLEILEGKNENYITEKFSKAKLKRSIFEVIERRKKTIDEEQEVFNEVFEKRKYFLFVKQLIYLVIFFISLISFYFITKDSIKSYRLYALAEEEINNNNFIDGESYFAEAFAVRPNITKIREIGETYESKQEYQKAEEKYQLALSLNPKDFPTLLSYGDFFFNQKKHLEADEVYQRYTEDVGAINVLSSEEKTMWERIGENYIQWGKVEPTQFEKGKEVYDYLEGVNPERKLFYYAKQLQIRALNQNYNESKIYYSLIQKENDRAIFFKPYIDYLSFLNNFLKNINSVEYADFIRSNLSEENNFIFSAFQHILFLLESKFPNSHELFFEAAKWEKNILDNDKALSLGLKALRLFEENKPKDFEVDNLYAFLGELNYIKKNNLNAINYFESAIAVNPQNPIANYFLGRINYFDLDNDAKALPFFEAALRDWQEIKNGPQYFDILYNLGYINYEMGKANTSGEARKINYEKALVYWNELAENISLEKSYLVDYNLGLVYLSMEKYDLAASTFFLHLNELENNYRDFKNNQDNFVLELERRIEILSDIYNNLGVIELNKSLVGQTVIDKETFQSSLNYFINSISTKNELGLLSTIPTSNFHTLNDTSLNQNIKSALQISDQSLPKNLFLN